MEKNLKPSVVIPVLLIIIAYEWLISSVNKLLTKNYYESLHQQMSQAISGIQFTPYANLVKNVGLPNNHVFGALVILGEFFAGISFVIIALIQLRGKTNRGAALWGIIASIVAAFMSLNYALLGGDTLLPDPANAFQEGISIDWILFFIEVTLLMYFASLVNQRSEASNKKR